MKKWMPLIAFFPLLSTVAMSQKVPVYLDDSKTIEQRVNAALSAMTLEEKVAMCHAQSIFSSKGVARLGIPELWMSDGPHGVHPELFYDYWAQANWTNDSSTAFPALTCLAASFNPPIAELYGKAVGEEARYRNKSVLLGPGVNIYRTPLNGRNFEYMGEDPFLASKLVVPYIKGVQSNGVAACVKHFALNEQETWRMDVDVDVSERALHEIYLPAFKAAVKEGKVWSVMGAYNKFRGHHCSHNDILLNQILKKEWKFDGVVISDWGGVHNTQEAAYNGLDLEMGTNTDGMTSSIANSYNSYFLAVPFLKELNSGKIDTFIVNEKARRILRLIFRTTMNRNRPFGSLATPEHAAVARKIAQEGMVLLKNDKQILPIPNTIKSIAVIGENATRSMTIGGGSSELKVRYEVSPLEGIKNRFGKTALVQYAQGYGSGKYLYDSIAPSPYDAVKLRDEAVALAAKSELVVLVGGLNKNSNQDCEGRDRLDYGLPFGQNELLTDILNVNKNVVLVVVSGNAVEMPWEKQVPAIVQAWYGGTESGNAIADILSGDVNPSGKLPFTFPVKLSDNGAISLGKTSYPGNENGHKQVYKDGIFVGYRWHDSKSIPPLFPFGHGLSYTQFAYSNLSLTKETDGNIKATFTIANKGKVSGNEVAQLYIHKENSTIERAENELKGFQKVFLLAGEAKTVSLQLNKEAFQYYNEKRKDWATEKGAYTILVGGSSREVYLKKSIVL